VAHEFCERVDLVAAGRFPLLHRTVPTGKRARARKVSGSRKLRVSFASLHRGGISQSSPTLPVSCHRPGQSPAPGALRIPVEVRCRSKRHVPGNGWDLLEEGAADE
jgi:hypothetical protein